MKTFFFTLILFALTASAEDCAQYIGSCQYYLCREKEHACGNKGYYLGFAYKYCRESKTKLVRHMSEDGKAWSQRVALCLQNSVEQIPYDDNCTDAKQTAYREHSRCYLDSGYCDLNKKDQLNVLWFVKQELYQPQVLKQGLSILNECR